MIVAEAITHGDKDFLLGFDNIEHPVALQLAGSNPRLLANAALIGEGYGYDEINLNIGCPSKRVQAGNFGACLMADPKLVAECVERIKEKKEVDFLMSSEKNSHILIKSNLKTEKILLNKILWIEAMGDYVKVITKDKKYLVLSTMKAFLSKLTENQFIRIHKSMI